MVFQIGEAIYINVRFRSHTELNAMAIPLFFGGIIKYFEKIWALRCASPKQLVKSFYSSSTCNNTDADNVPDNRNEMIRTGMFDLSKKKKFIGDSRIAAEEKFLREAYASFDIFKPLFLDLPFQISPEFHDDMVYLKSKNAEEAFNLVSNELGFLYDLHYTKYPIQHGPNQSCVNLILRSICFLSLVSVLIAFSALLHRIEHTTVDTVVTYLLLSGAVCLEIYSFFQYSKSHWAMLRANSGNKLQKFLIRLFHYKLPSIMSRKGIEKMAQYDLLDYYVKAKASWFSLVIKLINTANLLQRFGHCKWKPVDTDSKEFIYRHLKEKRSEYQKKSFKLKCLDELLVWKCDDILEKGFSLEDEDWKMESTDFTRRIFVWHMATTLVYYDDLHKHRSGACGSFLRIGKSLSDYMMYLVLVRPSMLPNGFSDMVNKETELQFQRIFSMKNFKVSKKEVITCLRQWHTDSSTSPEFGALLDGVKFAHQLQSLVTESRWDDEEKWKMISDIWMEMMVYAAIHCTWKEHAQQLRHGGELLTHVPLLMAHLGLSTQVHKLFWM